MSTTIDVYPTTDYLPLVEETRSRTQELYQQLFDRYGIRSTVEVKAFYPRKPGEELRYVDPSTRWKVEMYLGFAYLINGEWRASSWPSTAKSRSSNNWEASQIGRIKENPQCITAESKTVRRGPLGEFMEYGSGL
ncbi:hypothetical protein BLI708_08050 [Bifidobacterium imperatoris]|nr:hypothetical protein [Bifidobacterium imperatoris]QSY57191.1 hypothetical protein BLI708_08050 [Bifidobacterium imperatoris]